MVLYFHYPFPEQNFFVELIFLWARPVFHGFKLSYTLLLFTTPYILYSFLLSGIYVFTWKRPRRPKARKLPGYPPTREASALLDRKSTRLNSSHEWISYAVFCLKKKMHGGP